MCKSVVILKKSIFSDKGNETSKLYENLSSQPEGDKVNVKNIQLISTCSSSVEKHLSNECDLGIIFSTYYTQSYTLTWKYVNDFELLRNFAKRR